MNAMQIIERIKAVKGQTKLTVIDKEADKWFREHNIPLWRGLPAHLITKCATPSDDIEEPTTATITESCQQEIKSDAESGLYSELYSLICVNNWY
jgi:hypothetical protein